MDQNKPNFLPSNIKLIDFAEITSEQAEMVLQWRNHPEVSKWMINQAEIAMPDHLEFIQRLKNNKETLYYLVLLKNTPVGVIDFYGIKPKPESVYYGYYLSPNLIGSALGILLEFLVADYALLKLKCKKLIAETMPENKRANELHQQFGFVKTTINQRLLQEAILSEKKWLETRSRFLPIVNRLTS